MPSLPILPGVSCFSFPSPSFLAGQNPLVFLLMNDIFSHLCRSERATREMWTRKNIWTAFRRPEEKNSRFFLREVLKERVCKKKKNCHVDNSVNHAGHSDIDTRWEADKHRGGVQRITEGTKYVWKLTSGKCFAIEGDLLCVVFLKLKS